MHQAHTVDSLPQGAVVFSTGVRYTIWAPDHRQIWVTINETRRHQLDPISPAGYFEVFDPEGRPGDLYTFELDEKVGIPDFASRFQPRGVSGPSMVIDPKAFTWRCQNWETPSWKGQIVYELHLGTFSRTGTFQGAIEHLEHLRELGVTCVEIMPVTERAGRWNWGYDGTFLFAPTHTYGTPGDFRTLIDACHEHGLSVMLDVVFNHLGPQGNVSSTFTAKYFHSESDTPWGRNFDLDGSSSVPVRALLKQNITYWLEEFRIDGFRFDATHAIPDRSEVHLLAELSALVHEHGGFLVAEDERNAVTVIEDESKKGWNFDAAWADDFHHDIRVSQDPSRDRYFEAFTGSASEIAETVEHGWLHRGRPIPPAGIARGTECRHVAPEKFVYCISNHDQIGNRPLADRFHHAISPTAYRAVSLFFCLLPYTPLLFMGQEWAASSPFHFFTDFEGELGIKMAEYRRKEFARLGLEVPKDRKNEVIDPQTEEAFAKSKLDWEELGREPYRSTFTFYKRALALRKELHLEGNPGRTRWRVQSAGDVVLLSYTLPGRVVDVIFAVKRARDLQMPAGKTLFCSSDAEMNLDEPATVVIERPASFSTTEE